MILISFRKIPWYPSLAIPSSSSIDLQSVFCVILINVSVFSVRRSTSCRRATSTFWWRRSRWRRRWGASGRWSVAPSPAKRLFHIPTDQCPDVIAVSNLLGFFVCFCLFFKSLVQLHLLQAGGSMRGAESWPPVARRGKTFLQMPLRSESNRPGPTAQ